MNAQRPFATALPARSAAGAVALAPLGVPLRIKVAQAEHVPAVAAACRGWEGPAEYGGPALDIRMTQSIETSGLGGAEIEATGGRLWIRGSGVEASADAHRRTAGCVVSPRYFATPERLREDVLEPLVLFLLTRNGRTPIHASGFLAGDLAILAAGPSGAGKSCLALAADAAGWPVLSDDTIYLQQGPVPRVWGWPGAAHLLPDDCPRPVARTRWRNGRLKYAVPLAGAGAGSASAPRATLCLLARGGTTALEFLAPGAARRRLGPLEAGFDLLAAEIEAAHAALTHHGAWLLTLSAHAPEAIALVAANLPRLRATAAP